ncbi:hypothetical protein PILCRDRAFT_16182 [Piloderma croceum F 1598]|uniref:Uncharacterized protein n=1 Tax=Piloderma croceum (strain F 1598) TaxID=765440 RepID=A0A0C3EWK1_PILCF|nr:hypothetical protein PILCRDRAFT_16182 [Piloderma croceum F 1598]
MPNPIPRPRQGRRKATQSRIARTSVEPPATTSTTTADPLTTNEPPLHLLTRQSPVLSSSSSSAPFHSVTNQTPFQGPDTFQVQQQNTHGMDTQASSFINNLNLPNDFNAGGGSGTIVGFTRDLDTNGTQFSNDPFATPDGFEFMNNPSHMFNAAYIANILKLLPSQDGMAGDGLDSTRTVPLALSAYNMQSEPGPANTTEPLFMPPSFDPTIEPLNLTQPSPSFIPQRSIMLHNLSSSETAALHDS